MMMMTMIIITIIIIIILLTKSAVLNVINTFYFTFMTYYASFQISINFCHRIYQHLKPYTNRLIQGFDR
jgi:hypothetical protein